MKDLFVRRNGNGKRRGVEECAYDYTAENGSLLFQCVRYKDPKDFLQRRPDGSGGWIWNLTGVRRVLYRLPDVIATVKDHGTIYIVEGEKDADAINALPDAGNIIGTCNPAGASKNPDRPKWRPEYSAFLRGATVIIVQDKDEPGRAHARAIASSLKGIAASVRITEAKEGKDVSDHLSAGLTLDQLVPVPLDAETAPSTEKPDRVVEMRPAVPRFPRTDAGNAELFAHLYGDRVRFDHRQQRWLLFHDHTWHEDCDSEIRRLALQAARVRFDQVPTLTDSAEKKAEADHAIKSESRQKVEATLYFTQAIKPIADSGEQWDSDPYLLGTPGGVVDLRTGERRDGRPEDRITMRTRAPFDPKATCPRWERFQREVLIAEDGEPDDDLIEWHRRAVGNSATGDPSEQKVYVKVGSGSNGKGVHERAIANALGDYACNVGFGVFEMEGRQNIPSDLARLPGKRFVTASETNEGTRLNESRIKAISGGDPITARHLFQREFEYRPHLKLWLSVNHLPRVTDDSFGFWRRVRVIGFNRRFTADQVDPHLDERLADEGPGILAWITRASLAWQKDRLDPAPACVLAATRAYEDESDPLADFRMERLVDLPAVSTAAAHLFRTYQEWAEATGIPVKQRLTLTAFGRRMKAKYQKTKTGTGAFYHGVGVRTDQDDEGVRDANA